MRKPHPQGISLIRQFVVTTFDCLPIVHTRKNGRKFTQYGRRAGLAHVNVGGEAQQTRPEGKGMEIRVGIRTKRVRIETEQHYSGGRTGNGMEQGYKAFDRMVVVTISPLAVFTPQPQGGFVCGG